MAEQENLNGLDVQRMLDTVELLKQKSELGRFEFRAKNRWIDGAHNQASIKGFFGAGEEDSSREQEFTFDADEPPVLLGENRGVNPVEYLLTALSSCMTTTMVLHAAARGITLHEVQSSVDGDIDVRGLLGWEEVPVGFQDIRIGFKIKADCSKDQLHELVAMAGKYSPVYNTLTKGVRVEARLVEEEKADKSKHPTSRGAEEEGHPLH